MSGRETLKHKITLDIAAKLGELGTCDRAKVGAVITRDGRCIAWGFNGAPPGLPHCDENDHGWVGREPLLGDFVKPLWEVTDTKEIHRANRWREQMIRRDGCRNATHAEANALAFAARQGISTEGGTLYVNVSPCATCARLIIAAGIVRVVWQRTYRDPEGSRLLEAASVEKVVILPGD